MTKKRLSGLGKGLDALLPTAVELTDKGIKFKSEDDESYSNFISLIDLSKIVYNPYQPRKKLDEAELENLKNSIIENGIITPITVRKSINGFELIAGERRVKAALLAGMTKIPAFIRDIDTNLEMLELALIENLQRSDLNPIETANGFALLIEDHNLTQEQIAKKMGFDRATVANYLRLLNLPTVIQDALINRKITAGHAKALLGLSDKKTMVKAWNIVQDKSMNVRQTEKFVNEINLGIIKLTDSGQSPDIQRAKKERLIPSDLVAIIKEKEDILRKNLGVKVKINPKDDVSGSIEMIYTTIDDFDRIMEIIIGDHE